MLSPYKRQTLRLSVTVMYYDIGSLTFSSLAQDHLDGRAEDKTLEADERYLSILGFGEKARLYPEDVWHNSSLPVIVTYVLKGGTEQGVGLARNIAHFLPNHTLLVYYFGLPDQDIQAVSTT